MDEIEKLAEVFKALSSPTRLRLIQLLTENEGALCVNALAHRLEVSQSAVSQHLRILRQAELVQSDRHGFRVHYTLDRETLERYKAVLSKTLGEEFVVIQ